MQFRSKPVEEHRDVPVADEEKFETLVAHWKRRDGSKVREVGVVRSYVASVVHGKDEFPIAKEREILALAQAQGDTVVGHELCRIREPDPRALFRKGMANGLAARAIACGADTLLVDALLTPSQARNLEDLTGLSVRDREAVILNVFQRHAQTRKARIQVEIAHLQYLRPRIRGLGLEMDQQAGGVVGSRGPGETASELLARQLDGRLATLRKAFAQVASDADVQRKQRSECKRIALVGYTNAGKTTLMNGLTDAKLSAADQPFETLDTTSRCLSRHGGDVLLSDTVGFIRELPERLFASFESTLAEIGDSSLLAIVVDMSDREHEEHLAETERVLERLGAISIPRFYIFTKVDQCRFAPTRWKQKMLSRGAPHAALCGQDKSAIATLRDALLVEARRDHPICTLLVPYAATEATNTIYAHCRVLEAEPQNAGMLFRIQAEPRWLASIEAALERSTQ
tara:strand:- start:27399 stop:28769 length:1371 start_codon:yes stop_codon:yes gene_type:complete